MQILRELWTKDQHEEKVKTSYQYVVNLRQDLEDTLEIAHTHLRKAQARYKHHYDKKARMRSMKVGDGTLVLLRTDHKLLMQWKGPYVIVQVSLIFFKVGQSTPKNGSCFKDLVRL